MQEAGLGHSVQTHMVGDGHGWAAGPFQTHRLQPGSCIPPGVGLTSGWEAKSWERSASALLSLIWFMT